MTPEFKKIIQSLKLRQFAPVYLLDGEEPYYLDKLTSYFETEILPPAERDFNLIIIYGKDADWKDVLSSCRRFPMFAERQVVILKDAAQLRDLNELAAYINKPSPTTIFVIEHRFKKADGKTKLVKTAKEKGVHFTSDKIKDDAVPAWIQEYGKEIEFKIAEAEAQLLASYLGNDLQKIVNEITKVRINVPNEKELTSPLINKYIGISKEYNVFEFPETLVNGNLEKLYKMLAYFVASPKAAPMPLLIGLFYNQFNKLYIANFMKGKQDKDIAAAIGVSPFFVKNIMITAQKWPLARVERALIILAKYSAMAVGIKNYESDDKELLKEMIGLLLV